MNAVKDLEIIPLNKTTWRVLSGQNTYRISLMGGEQYTCSCPARVECKHIKVIKTLQNPEKANDADFDELHVRVAALEAAVQKLSGALSQVMQLGFVQDRAMVAIGDQYNGVWFYIDSGQPIESKMLNGYIRSIEFKDRGPGKRPSHHLHCAVDGDRRYILITGHETHFAKGLMKTIANMNPAQLARPVRINPQKSGETIFCNLHQDGMLIRARYGKDEDWKAIARAAKYNLAAALN